MQQPHDGQRRKFVRDIDLAERYSVSRATIWRWSSEGKLPQPVRLGTGTTRWDLDQVKEFEKSRAEIPA